MILPVFEKRDGEIVTESALLDHQRDRYYDAESPLLNTLWM